MAPSSPLPVLCCTVWMFSPTTVETRPQSRTIAKEPDYAAEVDGPEVAGFLSKMPAQVGQNNSRKYSGRRIDLDFKDADIHNILRLLSEVGGVNVVTADNVTSDNLLEWVGAGFLAVTPGDAATFNASTINWASSGLILANAGLVKLDGNRHSQD